MKRREFLCNGVALGTATLLPNVGIPANAGILSSAVEPLMPIWEAAVGGHWGIVKEWLHRDPSLINVTGKVPFKYWTLERTLFHVASALNPNVDFLKYLVSLGADVHTKDEFGMTPLYTAAERNSLEVIQYLISQGADVKAKHGYRQTTTLHSAAKKNTLEVLQYLISQGADVNAKDGDGKTPLLKAAKNNTLEVLKYLISQGADVNAETAWGDTPIHRAAEGNTLEVMQYLIAQGADVNAKYWKDTPLHTAAKNNALEVIQYIVAQGADVNAKGCEGQTPLHLAAGGNSVEALHYLVSQGADVKAKGSLGWTPLHKAAESNTLEVLQYLISQGADVDEETAGGDTPLLIAIGKNSNIAVVEYLVFKCSDVNAKDAWGSTSLHKAAGKDYRGDEWGIPRMQNLLLRGADVHVKNIYGKTPLDWADSDEKKRILLEAGAIPGKTSEPQSSDCNSCKNKRSDRMKFTGKFTDYILFDAIKPEIKATDKIGIIREMVQSLVDAGGITKEDYEGIVKAIFRREELGSTGIGRGIALPHIEHPSVKHTVGAVAISAEGIDFDCLDEEKAHLFFLVLSPPDFPGDHLRVMEHLTRRLKDDMFRCFLQQSKTREDVLALLEEDDSKEKR